VSVNKSLDPEDVRQTFLNALDNFGNELKNLTVDLKAIEIITAVGETTFKVEPKSTDSKPKFEDVTDLANAGIGDILGNITILARTRMELDGDLLVILPTTKTVKSLSSGPSNVAKTGRDADATVGENTAATTNIQENEPITINHEILNLHKENVNMAIQNLQFVYGKVMEIASKFAESAVGPNNIIKSIIGRR
jgi:hypothetical protein